MRILGLLRKALSSLLKYYSDAHNLHPLKNCNPMTCMWTNLVCKQQNIQKSFVILKTGKQTNKSKSCTFICPFHVCFILPSANSNDSFTFYLVLAFSIGWIILHFTPAQPSSLNTAFSWSAYECILETTSFFWVNNTLLFAYTILFIYLIIDGHLLIFAFWLLCLSVCVNTCM